MMARFWESGPGGAGGAGTGGAAGAGTGAAAAAAPAAWLLNLGHREYTAVWQLQKRLVSERQRDLIPDLLILVEHPHVITLGRGARAAQNVLAPGDMPIFEIERGGDVTYHGPGQLVGYPVLKLEGAERDLHRYLRGLEECLIRALKSYGITGERRPGLTGVWAAGRKLASIGVAVRRWVTLHGFALNVSTDLARFQAIHPCGLEASLMGSIKSLTGRAPPIPEVGREVALRFGEVFGRALAPAPSELWELDRALALDPSGPQPGKVDP
ncbi:MAG TPA: lipoyl(octanoyl) transferase LipB [Polyangia bacterium]|nr:lipoyl(octanoyl) transferase LipB [Polyangia bacterium]